MLKLLAALLVFLPGVFAQIRITQYVDDQQRVRLRDNRHPLAARRFDAGPVARDAVLERMVLALAPDAAQQQELDALIESQHDPSSPGYRKWLTPEEFGNRFGVSERDLAEVTGWLERHGFTIDEMPAGGRSIVFSGTATQVETAFHTEMRHYRVNGTRHMANARDVEIPSALAGVVGGVVTLHDFGRQALHGELVKPEMTSGGYHYLSPADFAAIYNVNPLYQSGVDGTGQTVAVVARININIADVTKFRTQMGLPPNDPEIVLNGPDPGIWSQGELTEALLDVQWAGAVAKKAAVKLVVSKSTVTDGVDLSAQYIVSHNLASTMTTSFGLCEAFLGGAENLFWKNLYQQAAAQGITAFVSTGDSGAAGCDWGSASSASYGRGVNGLASTPYNVAVGGTQFNDTQNPALYWASGNGAGYLSALGYIPEMAWNESGVAGGSGLWSTGGGASLIYSKPSWQTGPGVPADGMRDIPDVSLTAAGHVGYLVVQNGGLYSVGGTSASSPAFASLMALVVQQTGSRQGNANTAFYRLASAQASGGAAVFHDTTAGSNSVPGAAGFSTGAGFDLATGLGSVDAYQLATRWNVVQALPDLRLTASTGALTIQAGKVATVNLSVAALNGFNSSVRLSAANLPTGLTAVFAPATFSAPGSGSSTLTFTAAAGIAPGVYTVTVTAAGGVVTRQSTITVTATPVPILKIATSPSGVTISSVLPGAIAATVTVGGGVNTDVVLRVTNLPTGVKAVYSPASLAAPGSGSSTLNLTASASASPGTYTISLTATGASLTATTNLTLKVVNPPDLTLDVDSSLTVLQNASTTTRVVTAALYGFTAAVTLSAKGMPAGLSASFATAAFPAPGSGSSILTFTAAGGAPVGVYPIVITAAGGSLTRTATLKVTIAVPPSFSLTTNAAALSIAQGVSAALKATVSLAGSFNAPVALSVSGLPAGVTAAFAPGILAAPGSGSSTITLSVAPTVGGGARTLYITATSGGVAKTIPLTLTVTIPPVSLTPASMAVTLAKGGSVAVPLTLNIAGPLAGPVTLSAAGVPSGVTGTFATSLFSKTGTYGTSLTLKAAPAVPSGQWTITLKATDGNAPYSKAIVLTVR